MPHHSTGLGPGYGGLKCTFTLSADVRYTGPLDVQEEKEFEEKVKSAKAGMDGGLISVGEGSHRGCDLGVDGGGSAFPGLRWVLNLESLSLPASLTLSLFRRLFRLGEFEDAVRARRC